MSYSLFAQKAGKEFEEFKELAQMTPMGFGDEWLRFNGLGERVTFGMYNNDAPAEADKEQLYVIAIWAAERGLGLTQHWQNARVVDAGSNGSLHGMTKFHMDDAPVNEFFLEYIARPQTAEIFFEEVLMACVFFGMPILLENNKPRLLYHFKNRGYMGFCMNRPDREFANCLKPSVNSAGYPTRPRKSSKHTLRQSNPTLKSTLGTICRAHTMSLT